MNSNVCCVIVNFNDSHRVRTLVELIDNYDSIKYIVVVDNCSTDNSLESLKKIKSDKLILIESTKNGGYGYGNNLGIFKAYELHAEYVLIANPDVYFSDQCIMDMIIKIQLQPKCAIMNAVEKCTGYSAWKKTSVFVDLLCSSLIFNRLLHNRRYYKRNKFLGSGTTRVDITLGCFLMIPTEIMIKYGLYDEEIFLFEEEKILYEKFSKYGFHCYTDLDVSFEHRHIRHVSLKVRDCIVGKKRLIASKLVYYKKYRGLSRTGLFFSKIFLKYTIIEMAVYASLLVCFNIIKDFLIKVGSNAKCERY